MTDCKALSEDDVKTVVARALPYEGSIRVLNYELVSHSKIRIGFFGEHLNLLVKLKRDDDFEVETHSFFVKTIPELSIQQAQLIRNMQLFERESKFFNKLYPELSKDYVGSSWSPGCLLANQNVIVLEDMRTQGYAMLEQKIFDGAHLNLAVKAQARLHASSILLESRTCEPASDICPKSCSEAIYVQTCPFDLTIDLVKKIAERLDLDHSHVRPGLRKAFTLLYDPKNLGRRVISHGDAWPNNYLFKNERECVLIDFQMVRYAPRMYDVAQLVYFSTTVELRKQLERKAIEAYHEELCATLNRNNLDSEKPSLQVLLEEYEDARSTALLGAAIYYPIIFLTKKMLIDDEIYQKILLRKNNDLVMELYEEHEEYARRLNELTLEAVEHFDKKHYY